ncbi:MAG: T9SS type A sorting domain-containing protein [Saprospiraceae bacterium]|nr:T9SS type A sorting domain-containing protein [Saprospiraceae bacterium]
MLLLIKVSCVYCLEFGDRSFLIKVSFYFDIERQYESKSNFSTNRKVLASSNSDEKLHIYSFDNYSVTKSGIYYYRIKQVDRNGKFTYSRVISIKVEIQGELSLVVYPNPTDGILNIEIGMVEDSELEVRVFDEKGKNVFTNPFGGFRKAGTHKEMLNTKVLVPGQYNLQIKTSKGLINKRFTVIR